ncbi:MAG TPA: molybdopterin-dependent oxidoreductase [Acidobacteriota bacterium]|nr:molybdopterin-dependent oxidoreductase [Acidobacteriota bacterium]
MELFESQKQLDEGNRKITRRVFVGVIVGGVAAAIGKRFYDDLDKPPSGIKTDFISQIGEFYTIYFNEYPTNLTTDGWSMRFAGPEGKSFSLDYNGLKALPNKLIYKTFECIENGVGENIINNAEWRVTPLQPLLDRILPTEFSSLNVIFRAYDGYYTGLPIADVYTEESYLAYEMNGQPLPLQHGRPARVLLPGKYGYKQPKWLKEIEVTAGPLVGYWESKGWAVSGEVKLMSRIDTVGYDPKPAGDTPGDALITGIAYGGRFAVSKVEVSLDNGSSWQPAEVTSPTGPNHWSLWKYVWPNAPRGRHKILVRMTDANGKLQPEARKGYYPAGSSGWHRVVVKL